MTFDRRSMFDRSFFDRMMYLVPAQARVPGKFTTTTRTRDGTVTVRPGAFSTTTRTGTFNTVH